MLCDGVFALLSVVAVVAVVHAIYCTYGPPCLQCLDTVEFELYSGRSWIPARLFDVDRYIENNLRFAHKYSFFMMFLDPLHIHGYINTTWMEFLAWFFLIINIGEDGEDSKQKIFKDNNKVRFNKWILQSDALGVENNKKVKYYHAVWKIVLSH